MVGMFRRPAMTLQYMTDISRISSTSKYPRARRAHWLSQASAIIALTLTA
jgi:hypothetical protein